MAQLSSILMQYIDAAMVGRLGADDSAAVGLVSTSLWLFWGICSAATVGFSVQVAHRVGASDYRTARAVLRQGIVASICFGIIMAVIGMAISPFLPYWLGGDGYVAEQSTVYFFVFVAALPMLTLNYLGCAILRASGNMKVPGGLNIIMCVLDVIFNYFLIFPSRTLNLFGADIFLSGAGLGVLGAALGTVAAECVCATAVMYYLCWREKGMCIIGKKCGYMVNNSFRNFIPTKRVLSNALKVSAPMTLEHAVICGAQIMVTIIVAPLGVMAIAANSFAVTAEALCYMPGYGIADAATTLTGQSYGAGRKDLAKSFGYITVCSGIIIMTVMGIIMWLTAPLLMDLFTPVKEIAELGSQALRIEAWAEPMFAASIVAYGVMIGVGDTILPAIMNFGSIWLVRIPLAAILAPTMGLAGVWTAMCIELTFRGAIFLWRLIKGAWLKHGLSTTAISDVAQPQPDPDV
ncbi:MAG: MATE family efflux transporter [Paramuribaculum sp.]|nr:MATE family efflux transporter [Paramuribaculum sp.]